jgi:hypothetical protein
MQERRIAMRRLIQRSIAVTMFLVIPAVLGARFAEAHGPANRNRLLNGDYAFTSFRSCIQAVKPGPEDSVFGENFALQTGANSRTTTIQGTLRYNGNGTGSAAFRFLSIFPGFTVIGNVPINGGETACELEYTVNADGSFVQLFSNCSGVVEFGAGAPGTFEITGGEKMGQISQDRKTLILSDTNPNVETLDVTRPDGSIVEQERICNRSGVAIRVRRHAHDHEVDDLDDDEVVDDLLPSGKEKGKDKDKGR